MDDRFEELNKARRSRANIKSEPAGERLHELKKFIQ